MATPFSDTTTPAEPLPPEWQQVAFLAQRLGLQPEVSVHPSKWSNVLTTALHCLLDRLEKLEQKLISG